MHELPETRDTLLNKIQDPDDQAAWEEFVSIYQPVIYRVAISRGLQNADANDLVQTVLVSVAGSISRWEKREQGTRFGHWLLRVAKNATINALTRRPPDLGKGGSGHIEQLLDAPADDSEAGSLLETEYRRQLYLAAAEEVKNNVSELSWQAFEQTAVQGLDIKSVAQDLGKSVGALYAIRSRIMKQLGDAVSRMENRYQ